jgi:hypothetical protein
MTLVTTLMSADGCLVIGAPSEGNDWFVNCSPQNRSCQSGSRSDDEHIALITSGADGPNSAQGFSPVIKDVNGDGRWDLVVKFSIADAGIFCGGPTEVRLSALTYSSRHITGETTITLKGCK